MKRRLFNILSAVSLLLGVVMAVMWVRDLHSEEGVSYAFPNDVFELSMCNGRVAFEHGWAHLNPLEVRGARWYESAKPMSLPEDGWEEGSEVYQSYGWHGFAYEMNLGGPQLYWLVTVPGWCVALVLLSPGIGQIVSLYRNRGRRTKLAGLCSQCGYDLRASVERCPECGTPIPAGALPVGEDKTVSRPS